MLMIRIYFCAITKVLLLLMAAGLLMDRGVAPLAAQTPPAAGSAISLYRDLLNPTLNAVDVHQIRGVSIDREDLHISLSDGMLGLIQAVDGRVTGAVFEGSGEILLIAPNRAERTSLALFTGAAVLEQKFGSAYFRFVDDKLVEELARGFRQAEPADAQEFITRWQQPARDLARSDSLPIMQSMTNRGKAALPYLHVRLGGTQLGVFDVFYDGSSHEQISVAKATVTQQAIYFDTWASFPGDLTARREPNSRRICARSCPITRSGPALTRPRT